MTDSEYPQQSKDRLEQLRDEQERLHDRLTGDMSRMTGLRISLPLLAGALALGLSVGCQIGRR